MLLFTPDLLADEVEVLPGGLRGRNEARLRQLVLFVLRLFLVLYLRIVHRSFNAVQQEFILILLVSFDLVQVKFLYSQHKRMKKLVSQRYSLTKKKHTFWLPNAPKCLSKKRVCITKTKLTSIGFDLSLHSLFSLDLLGLLLLFLGHLAQFEQLNVFLVWQRCLHLLLFLSHDIDDGYDLFALVSLSLC